MKGAWVCLVALVAATATGAAGGGCSSSSSQPAPYLSRDLMIQPETCAKCHQSHFNDWFESAHAKASDDPVFIAMNKRGQRETNGTLGKFCVQCHAPMAVRDGKTTDGLNLAALPSYYRGVTCFFCHSIDSVGATHDNASVNLATDLVMRGEIPLVAQNGIPAAVANSAHASGYSTFHDDTQRDSATMCGSCHDIDSPKGAHIERTFAEWSASAYPTPGKGLTCSAGGCHMTAAPKEVPIATGGPKRPFHAHNFPAVDVPLESISAPAEGSAASADSGEASEGGTPISSDGNATTAVQNALNSNALAGALCVTANSGIRVILDTIGIGHQWPSGAAQDRRAWAEVIAYDSTGAARYSSGVVPDGTAVTSTAATDPDLWLLRDCMFNAQAQPVVNFWEAATTNGFELPALATFDKGNPKFFANHIVQSFPRANSAMATLPFRPVRVTLRIRIQPVGLDVLEDLVQSNDLDPSVVAKMPTFDVSLQGPIGPGFATPGGLEWTSASNDVPYTDEEQGPATCAATPNFNPGIPVTAKSAATCPPPSQ